MAAPLTKRHATLVSDFAAAAQGASAQPLDFSEGSVFLAHAEASAGIATWLQKLYIFALSVTRLASSFGIWVDQFIAPFGMTRLAAGYATGLVNFTRYNAVGTIGIPVGTQVATADGSQVFQVYADLTNGAYSPSVGTAGGYQLLAGALTVRVPVQALTAGTAGNVAAGTITKLQSPVAVDAITNTAGFTNGSPAETDAAVKARFPLFIASLARATRGALAYAVAALGLNLQSAFAEFQQRDGTPADGMNCVFVDDGSGAPPAATVAAAANAVGAYRAFGVRIGVFPATQLQANISLTLVVAATYNQAAVVSAVVAALTTYINGLGMGVPLPFTRIADIAYSASAGVTNVTAVSLNGAANDLVPTMGQTIKVGNILPLASTPS